MHPSAVQVMATVVWVRYTVMTAETLNEIDNSENREEVQQKVDDFCVQIENLMVEWRMESTMRDNSMSQSLRYLVADHVMNMYAIIIGIKRQVRPADSNPVDAIALRAARKVAQITVDFTIDPAPSSQSIYV